MALITVFLRMPEYDFAIVAGSAEHTISAVLFGDFRFVDMKFKAQFKVTDPAGIFSPMAPMGKEDRFNSC